MLQHIYVISIPLLQLYTFKKGTQYEDPTTKMKESVISSSLRTWVLYPSISDVGSKSGELNSVRLNETDNGLPKLRGT